MKYHSKSSAPSVEAISFQELVEIGLATEGANGEPEAEAAYVAAYNEWLKQPMSVGRDSIVYQRYNDALHAYAAAIERKRGPLPELHIAADPNLTPEKHEAVVKMFGLLAERAMKE